MEEKQQRRGERRVDWGRAVVILVRMFMEVCSKKMASDWSSERGEGVSSANIWGRELQCTNENDNVVSLNGKCKGVDVEQALNDRYEDSVVREEIEEALVGLEERSNMIWHGRSSSLLCWEYSEEGQWHKKGCGLGEEIITIISARGNGGLGQGGSSENDKWLYSKNSQQDCLINECGLQENTKVLGQNK